MVAKHNEYLKSNFGFDFSEYDYHVIPDGITVDPEGLDFFIQKSYELSGQDKQ